MLILATTIGQNKPHEYDPSNSDKYVSYSKEIRTIEFSLKDDHMPCSLGVTSKFVGLINVCRIKGKRNRKP